VNLKIVVRYKHEISLIKDAKANQEADIVRYNREFVITVIVITRLRIVMHLKSVKNMHANMH